MVQCNRSVALHHDVYYSYQDQTVIVEKAMRQKGVRANPDVAPILQDDWKLMKTYVSKGDILLLVFLVRIRASSSLPKRGDVCRGES